METPTLKKTPVDLDGKFLNFDLLKAFNSSSKEEKAISLLNYLESPNLFTKEDLKDTKVAMRILGPIKLVSACAKAIKRTNLRAGKLASFFKKPVLELEPTISEMAEKEVQKQLRATYEFYLIKTSQEERRLNHLINIYQNFVDNPNFVSPVTEITMKSHLIQFALDEKHSELQQSYIAKLAKIGIEVNV